jgi:hypothetical protein
MVQLRVKAEKSQLDDSWPARYGDAGPRSKKVRAEADRR